MVIALELPFAGTGRFLAGLFTFLSRRPIVNRLRASGSNWFRTVTKTTRKACQSFLHCLSPHFAGLKKMGSVPNANVSKYTWCLTSTEILGTGRRGGGGGGVWRLGEREIIYLSLHCRHQNDSCIKMGSDESHCNVSLIVRGKVKTQCTQTTTFEEKGEPKRIRTEVPLLTSLTPYR